MLFYYNLHPVTDQKGALPTAKLCAISFCIFFFLFFSHRVLGRKVDNIHTYKFHSLYIEWNGEELSILIVCTAGVLRWYEIEGTIYIYAPFVKGKHLFSCLFVCFVAKIQRQRDLQWWIRSEKLSNTHCLFCFDGKLAFQELLERKPPKVLAPSRAYSWSCMAGPTLGNMWMANLLKTRSSQQAD